MTYQIQMAETRDLLAGDLFKTPDGGIFVAINNLANELAVGSLVYHCMDATNSYEGQDLILLSELPQPFTLLMTLSAVKQ